MILVTDRPVDIFGDETSVELLKILFQESNQSNHVSPEPPFPRAGQGLTGEEGLVALETRMRFRQSTTWKMHVT